jgi:hypothetical protein
MGIDSSPTGAATPVDVPTQRSLIAEIPVMACPQGEDAAERPDRSITVLWLSHAIEEMQSSQTLGATLFPAGVT